MLDSKETFSADGGVSLKHIREQLHPLKAKESMVVTEFGMFTIVRLVQPLKVLVSIDVIEFGMLIEMSEEQPSKAESPMDMTEFGMLIEVNPEQYSKTRSPIVEIPSCKMTETKLDELRKALLSMLFTLDGIVILVIPVLQKAFSFIAVTPSGIVTDFKLEQP